MYQRYQPGVRSQQANQRKPTMGEIEKMKQTPQKNRPLSSDSIGNESCHKEPPKQTDRSCKAENPILKLLPSTLYNRENGKILGIFSAEDLLLVGLIFLFLESKDTEDSVLVFLLLYVLISDYIDLPI